MNIYNAKITSTEIGYIDKDNFTAWVFVSFCMGTQGFGGVDLSEGIYLKRFLNAVLGVTGINTWGKLPGTYVRIKEREGKLVAIGNIIEDSWFDLEKDM